MIPVATVFVSGFLAGQLVAWAVVLVVQLSLAVLRRR